MSDDAAPDSAHRAGPVPGGPERRDRLPHVRPPRPALAESAPAPIAVAVPPTGPVKAARSLWLLSFAAGLFAALLAFFNREAQLERLRETAAGIGSAQETSTLDTVAAIAWWSSLGGLLLATALEALLLAVLLRRRGWARWALLAVLLIHLGVVLVAAAFLTPPGAAGTYVTVLLGVQLVLAAAALTAGLLPRAGAWFRAGPQGAVLRSGR